MRSVPGPWSRIASNRRSVTVAATLSSFRARVRHASAGSGSSSRQMCAIVSQSRSYASSASSVRVDELRPARRRRGGDAPVRGGAVDDVAGVREVREDVAAGASRVDARERLGVCRAGEGDARGVLVGEPLEPVDHPRRHVVERRLVRVEQPLTLDARVEHPHVHPSRAVLVGGARDLVRQRLLAGVRRDGDDLAGLHVGAVPDDEVGEAAGEVGVVLHRRGAYPGRMAPCA